MVLESLVTSILNKYLGMYIEGLDPAQLQMNVWSGVVDLKNLKIKSSCLDSLHLPIKVKVGFVGHLLLSVNWRKLSSEPVRIELEDIFLIAELEKEHTYDEEVERLNALQDKLMKLKTMEEFALSFGQSKGEASQQDDDGFTAALTQKIIDNLQVSIKRIHLRFESSGFRSYNKPVALGFCLQGLQAVTTDAQWRPKFVTGEKMTYKMLDLDNMFMYVSTKPEDAKAVGRDSWMAEIFSSKTIQYLLRPVSGYLQMTTNKQDTPSPKVNIVSALSAINATAGEDQYHALLSFLSAIGNEQEDIAYELSKLDLKFRKGTEEERKNYISLYKKTLNATWLPELTSEELQELNQMEKELNYEDLAKYRAGAIAEVGRELRGKRVTLRKKAKHQDEKQKGGGWLSGWWGSSELTPSSPAETTLDEHVVLTDQDREAIYAAVSYDSHAYKAPDKFAPNFVLTQVSFKLGSFGFALCSAYSAGAKPLVQLEATDAQVSFRQYPNASVLQAKLHVVTLKDDYTPNSLYPNLLSASPSFSLEPSGKSSSASAASPFLQVTYENNPLDAKNLDARLRLKLLPHELVLHGPVLARISQFFATPQTVDLHTLSQWSATQFDEVWKSTSSSLADSLKQYSAMQIELDLDAPTVLMPVDPTKSCGDLLVCDLGLMKFETFNQDKDVLRSLTKRLSDGDGNIAPKDRDQCYDRFEIQISNVRMFLIDAQEWKSGRQAERHMRGGDIASPVDATVALDYIFLPIDIGLTVRKCAATGFPSLPDMKVHGKLPLLSVSLSSSNYHRLLRLGASFSNAQSDAIASDSSSISSEQAELPQVPPLARLLSQSSLDNASLVEQLAASGTNKETVSRQAELSLLDLIALLGTEAKAVEVMKQIDLDGDGSVTGEEFHIWWEQQKKDLKHQEHLDLSFTIPKIELLISHDRKQGLPLPVLRAEIKGIEMQMKQRYFDTTLTLQINAVALIDELTGLGPLLHTAAPLGLPSSSKSQSSLVAPPPEPEDFFLVQYKQISDDSPDWEKVDKTVRVQAGAVIVRLNPESLKALTLFFLKEFLAEPEASVPKRGRSRSRTSSASSLVSSAPSNPKPSPLPAPSDASTKADHDRQMLQTQFNFGALRILLLIHPPGALKKEPSLLTEIAALGFESKIIQRTGSMDAEVLLQDFAVIDRSPKGREYPDIIKPLVSEKNSAVSQLVKVIYRTLDPRLISSSGCTAELNAEFSGLRIVFLNRYVQELVQFATSGPMAELQASFSEKKADVVPSVSKENALPEVKTGESSFTKILIVLSGMDLIVPQRSDSHERMSFALDRVEVSNSLMVPKTDVKPYERYSVLIREFSTRSFLSKDSKQAELLESFLVRMKGVSCIVDGIGADTFVATGAESIELKLAHRQYCLIMYTLEGNLAEEAMMLPPAPNGLVNTAPTEAAHAALADVANAAASKAFQLKLSLPNMKLTLQEEFGVEDADALVQLELLGTEMELNAAVDTLEFNLDMSTVQLNDLSRVGAQIGDRAVLSPYRHLIDIAPSAQDGPVSPFTLRFKQSPEGRKVFLSLQGLHFSMGKVILELPTFFTVAENPQTKERRFSDTSLVELETPGENVSLKLESGEEKHEIKESKSSSRPTKEAKRTPDPLPLHLELKILDPMIQLVSDPTSRLSSALSLSWNLYADVHILPGDITQVVAVMNDVEVFVSELDAQRSDFLIHRHSRQIAERILMPVFMKASVDIRPSERLKGEQATNVTVNLGDLESTFTYTSYQLFLACLNALGTSTNFSSEKGDVSTQEVSMTANQEVKSVSQVQGSGSYGEQRIEVNASSLHVELINNVLGFTTPLIQVDVKRFSLDVLGYSHMRSFDLEVGLAINYFNNSVATWEPLLEPYQLQLCAFQVYLANLSERRKPVPSTLNWVRLESSYNMELNLTAAMIKGILDTMDVLTLAQDKMEARAEHLGVKKLSSLRSPNSGGFQGFKPFILVNQTEFNLRFQAALIEPRGGRTSSGPSASVAAWSELSFELPRDVGPGGVPSVAVNLLQNHGWPPLELSLIRVGSWQHTLISTDTNETVRLVSELEIVRGVKRISLHSARGVQNETSLSIRLDCTGDNSGCLANLPKLLTPGQQLWLPLCAGHEAKSPVSLRFSPLEDDSKALFGLSGPLKLTHPFRASEGWHSGLGRPISLLYCASSVENAPFFSLAVSVNRSKYSTLFVLRPPFAVRNSLISPISIGVCGVSGKSSSGLILDCVKPKLIECANLTEFHSMDNESPTRVRLQMRFTESPSGWFDTKEWSGPIELSFDDPESKQIATASITGETRLYVNVKTAWEKGQLIMSVTVPFWLRDASGEALKIVGEKQPTSHFIQMDGNQPKQAPLVMYNVRQDDTKEESKVTVLTKQGWSRVFPFRVGVSSLVGPQEEELAIGYQTELAGAVYPGTQIVTFAPKYILVNRLPVSLSVAQLEMDEKGTLTSPHSPSLDIGSNSQVNYFWPLPASSKALVVRRKGAEFDDWLWSGAIFPDRVCQRELMIRHTSRPNQVWFCRIETLVRGPTLFTVITPHAEPPSPELKNQLPFRIENRSVREQIQFCQVLNPNVRVRQLGSRWMDVGLHQTVPFALEDTNQPSVIRLRVGFRGYNSKGEERYERTFPLDLEELDTSEQTRIPLSGAPPHTVPRSKGSNLWLFMETEGPVRVLVFADFPNPRRNISSQGEEALSLENERTDIRTQLKYRLTFQKVVISDMDLLEQHRFNIENRLQTVLDAKVPRPDDVPDHLGQLRVDILEGKNLPDKSYAIVRFTNGSSERKSGIIQGRNPKWNFRSAFTIPTMDVLGSSTLTIEIWQSGLFSDSMLGKLQWHLLDLSTYQPTINWFNLQAGNSRGGSVRIRLWWITPSPEQLLAQLHSIQAAISDKREILKTLENDARTLFQEVQEEDELQKAALAGDLSPLRAMDAFRNSPRSRIELSFFSLLGAESLLPPALKIRQGFRLFRFRFTRTRFAGHSLQLQQLLLFCGKKQLRPNETYNIGGRPPAGEGAENLSNPNGAKFRDRAFAANGYSLVYLEFSSPVFATEALIKTANDSPGRDPLDFTIEATHDQETWYALAKVVNANAPRERRTFYPAVVLNPFAGLPGRLECVVRFPMMQQEAAVLLWSGDLEMVTEGPPPAAVFIVPDAMLEARPRDEAQLLLTFQYRPFVSNLAWVEWQTVAGLSLPIHGLPVQPMDDDIAGRRVDATGLRSEKFTRWVDFQNGSGFHSVALFLGRFRARNHAYQPNLRAELALRHVGVSMITETPEELLYFHLARLFVQYEESQSSQALNLSLGTMQLDNQQPRPTFRIVMAPSPLSQEHWQPLIQLTVVKTKEIKVPVQVFEYVTVLLQKIEIKLEEQLIYKIVTLANHLLKGTKQQDSGPGTLDVGTLLEAPAGDNELYFESLHLQPMAAKISFEAKPGMRGEMAGARYNPVSVLLNVAGSTLGNLDEVPLELTGYLVTNVRGDIETILPGLMQRYQSDLFRQLYKVVGSMEVIGNPVGLLSNLGSGVHDAFYEPYKGLVKSPKDFALGVHKGGKSLLLSMSGLAGSLSKISRTFGKGAAVLSMDEHFAERSEQKTKPKDAVDGVVSATRSLGTGIISGLTGVVTSPLEGAQRDGAAGFARGIGSGMVGLVAKPVSGMFIAMGQTLQGVETSAKKLLDDRVENAPYRPPRQFTKELTLTVYQAPT
eukprot:gb/GEZN01000029.1/.p1 GENE.gb/GEZN01000029.1/~~gb/GEZN01000029.1/.p1  ORF type:complete len:3687 (-),score=441.49 gb/GEZN01000029.1/:130-11190(-)